MKRQGLIWVALLFSWMAFAQEPQDSAVYQGTNLKLDLGNTVFELVRSKGQMMSYEMAANVNLMRRFFPTLEGGYAQAERVAEGGEYMGKGGFVKLGIDFSMLKKNKRDNHLMLGLRIATGMQTFSLSSVSLADDYWNSGAQTTYANRFRCDAWGEIVAGLQVQIYKSFHMGWYARFKILMTRQKLGEVVPYYIPGYGYTDDTTFGFNYYIGFQL